MAAASLFKAWSSAAKPSSLIHNLVKCPVRAARSNLYRKSVKIISPEEQEKLLLKKQGYILEQNEVNSQPQQQLSDTKNLRKSSNFNKQNKNDVEEPLKYEKLQEGDKRFGPVVQNAKLKKSRQKSQQILLEGQRLISDALLAGAHCCSIYFTSEVDPNKLPVRLSSQIPIYKVKYKHMKLWSDVVTPPGIMAVFKMPSPGEAVIPQTQTIPLTLICDNIQDSGNMGSLIRTAAAVGCKRILTTTGSVDVWEPKVIRSGCGSHFRIPILNHIPWSHIPNYVSSEAQILLASNTLENQLMNPERKTSLSFEELDSLVNLCEQPSLESVQSLDKIEETSPENLKDRDLLVQAPILSEPYEQVSFASEEIVLVIGSEAHGLSPEAKKLAFSQYGQSIYIPLAHGVESLNSVVAAGIIMFEIRKQIHKRMKLELNTKYSVKNLS